MPLPPRSAQKLFSYPILKGLGERKLVLESCLRYGSWGLLEMYILLTDHTVEFDVVEPRIWNLDAVLEQLSPTMDIKLDYMEHQDLLLSLLVTRSPVSNSITKDNMTSSCEMVSFQILNI